jgi:hypothetical protein
MPTAARLGSDLREAGYKLWADKIDAVIEGGSTSSEILMGLRWTMDQLIRDKHGPAPVLMQRSLRRAIDAALS